MVNILDLIYPNVCGMCNKVSKNNICNKCYIKIKELEKMYKLDTYGKYFDEGFSLFKYDGIIRDKIIDYKFNNKPYLYKIFAQIFLKNEKMYRIFKKYDIIIPVPISRKRNLKRGYNQTELIACSLAKNTNLKKENKILIKVKNVVSQSELTKEQRIENVKGAFKIKNKIAEKMIENKNIILFDDIYTTGSTANECAKVLKKAKVNNILVLTIAKD